MKSADWKYRWHAIMILQDRNSQATMWGMGLYIIISIALLLSALAVHNHLRFTERNDVFVSRQPLFLPVFVNTILVSLYLGVIASITASRERDRGTLEVLFYGPVDEISFLIGSFLAHIKIYLISVLFTIVWLNLVTWVVHLAFSIEVYIVLATSILTLSVVIAFGLLTAMWGGRTRIALVYFIFILLILVGIQLGDQAISSLVLVTQPTSNDPLLIVRNVLAASSTIVQWISPYAQLDRLMDAVLEHNWSSYLLHVGVVLIQTFLLLEGSIFILRRKGVRG